MMNTQRNLFVIVLLFVSFITWKVWEKNSNSQSQIQQTQITQKTNTTTIDTDVYNYGKEIIVKTDVLELTINTRGSVIERALLLNYPKELNSNEPFQLLRTTTDFIYQAQSGFTGRDGPDNPRNGPRPLYHVDKDRFILDNGQQEIVVPMIYKDAIGNRFKKTFILKRGEYTVNVEHSIQNTGIRPIEVSNFGQLKQSMNLPAYLATKSTNFVLHTFRGAAYSTYDKKYEKYKFESINNNKNLNVFSKGGWIAMLQQYFATAWIPHNNGSNNFYTTNLNNGIVAIGYKSQPILVQPGQTYQTQSTLWIGPEIQDKMASIAPYLDLTVDYGWLWFISQPLFKLLKIIYSYLGNWGYAIIAITFILRGIMYPLTKAQYTSMAKIRILQPKIQEIRHRLKDNKQRISQEMMAMYKEEKVNPFGGCFPLIVQMPIFLALYCMLLGSVELRHAPFALWVNDLSAQDPYYILPILMGLTMYFLQRISPATSSDPVHQKMMNFMPMVFTVFFLWFPSGLVLYYIVSNVVTIIQQQLIYRTIAQTKHKLHDHNHKKKK